MSRDWPTVALRDLCSIARGGSPRPIKNFITNDPDGINWIKIGDTQKGGRYIDSTAEKITPAGVSRSRFVDSGSFLLSNSMSFGRPYILRASGCIHDGWLVLEPDYNRVDQDFLYHVLGSRTVFDQFDSLAAGSTVRNLNIGLVKGVEIPLPPLEEQRRIVAVLDEAFEGLGRARAHTEANLQNARELFGSELVSVCKTHAEQYGTIPLAGLSEEITDGDHMPPPKAQEGVPFVTIKNINKETHAIDFSDTFKVPESYYQELKDKRKPKVGDVLYTVTGSFGIPVMVQPDQRFCFQRHIGLIRPKRDVSPEWLYFVLASPFVFEQADAGATGTAQRTVSLKLLRTMLVPDVPPELQSAIANRFRGIHSEARRLAVSYQAKLQDLDDLRQSLLQKAFAGKLT
ncbi:restriction endonuclease subunit S [Roseinatronobacter monicus]|uniref:Type I restriction enzyme S subunit n=1 Tax=Roseinatronobacter monicus TaxID=393481 RepID=A0A543KBI7_9RHOB|nr:restriction endonuclease subunit S [Roseinatronobacter monicus]TQM92461.1 type I restriction enzyme S subunit [Roseinatronobacter monicus]